MNTHVEERKNLWFLLPIVLLGGLLSLLAVLIGIATRDDGFAVEPDYYEKASAWDETMAERAQSARLGWSSRATLGGTTAGSHLSLELLDAVGRPVAGAHVEVEAFHNARAANVEHAVLSETTSGRYEAALQSGRPGLWEVRITATGPSGERYVETKRLDRTGAVR